MVIGKIIGGLGNQMFQYAFYKYISINKGVDLKLDISLFKDYFLHNGYELEQVFGVDLQYADSSEIDIYKSKYPLFFKIENKLFNKNFIFGKKYFRESNFLIDKKLFCNSINEMYVEGYFQTSKYISEVDKKTNNKLFEFNTQLADFEKTLIKDNSVSVHIRGGDYLTNSSDNKLFGGICTKKYYKNAIEYVRSNIKNPKFLIFTNDINYSKTLLGEESFDIVDWNTGEKSYRDMYLMSLCKHNIVANSSFSWWGAWLNNNPHKTVIAPKKWFNDYKIKQDSICPNSWIRL